MNRKSFGVLLLLTAGAACGAWMMDLPVAASAQEKSADASSWKSAAKPVETSMHEYMEYVNQPTFKSLKSEMADAQDPNWGAIKSGALILAESANLVLLRGPELDRETWVKDATAVREAGRRFYRAAHEKDFDLARKNYEMMVANCNQCHQNFAHGEHQLTP